MISQIKLKLQQLIYFSLFPEIISTTVAKIHFHVDTKKKKRSRRSGRNATQYCGLLNSRKGFERKFQSRLCTVFSVIFNNIAVMGYTGVDKK